MKLGVCQWSLPVDGPYAIKTIADLGLKGIQLDIGSHDRGFPLSLQVVQEAYKEFTEKYGVTITALAVRELDNYGMTRKDGTPEKEIVLQAISKAIEIANSMEVPIVMLASFEDGEIKTEQDFNTVVDCLKNACDEAEKYGLMIATENLLSIEETKKLFKLVDRPNLKLYFDTQNYYLRKNYNTAEMVRELFPYICEVHVKDGADGSLSGSLLGEGDSGFFETMEVLKEKGYSGWLHLENYYDQLPLSLQDTDPMELLKKDISILENVVFETANETSTSLK
ncbi:sugar phosphate isomerase/epimerase family protein [Sporosarcina newyorkensis]|uniref:Sugar phosphate isomerase/epimerase n=1 Tax=Sporosarcina newyorkensis TaxID=759851 RepID=A0A1T4YLI5_9BACL|nr:sugar phosphate isomerase/epimerase family protein [Sporosarcina newyorkensis]SKB02616.1 Sugar phosphate isomerase/epimerase [Sporosarcina newyorkensis]